MRKKGVARALIDSVKKMAAEVGAVRFDLETGVSNVNAQKNKSQLEKEKNSVQKQIQETQQILAQTSNRKKASIGQLNALKKTIAHQIRAMMKEKGIRKTEMALRMKTSRSSLERLLNEESYNATISTISKAATVLGKRIEFSLVDNNT